MTQQGIGGQGVNNLIKSSREFITPAYNEIRSFQRKEKVPAKTGYDYIDKLLLGGLYPETVMIIGGRPGGGKSYFAKKIEDTIMDLQINPRSANYVFLNCEFEMTARSILLRRLKEKTGRRMTDILLTEPTDYELKEIHDTCLLECDPRVSYISEPVDVPTLDRNIESYCELHKDKELILVKIDHIAMTQGRGAKPDILDDLCAMVNKFKLKRKNIAFILLSQLNREIEKRIGNPANHFPLLQDLYQSDAIGQTCTIALAVHSPLRYGIEKYGLFGKRRYPYLDRFKSDTNTSFKTEGLIFYHVLKVRDMEEPILDDVQIEIFPGYERLYGEVPKDPIVADKVYEQLHDFEKEISPDEIPF